MNITRHESDKVTASVERVTVFIGPVADHVRNNRDDFQPRRAVPDQSRSTVQGRPHQPELGILTADIPQRSPLDVAEPAWKLPACIATYLALTVLRSTRAV